MRLFHHFNVKTGKASRAHGQGWRSAWPQSWVIQTASALLVIIHISHISGFESDMSAILITSCQPLWHPGLRTISTAPICIDVPESLISPDSQVQNIIFFRDKFCHHSCWCNFGRRLSSMEPVRALRCAFTWWANWVSFLFKQSEKAMKDKDHMQSLGRAWSPPTVSTSTWKSELASHDLLQHRCSASLSATFLIIFSAFSVFGLRKTHSCSHCVTWSLCGSGRVEPLTRTPDEMAKKHTRVTLEGKNE